MYHLMPSATLITRGKPLAMPGNGASFTFTLVAPAPLFPPLQGEGEGGDGVQRDNVESYVARPEPHPHPYLPPEREGMDKLAASRWPMILWAPLSRSRNMFPALPGVI